jgi:hypothetical protein
MSSLLTAVPGDTETGNLHCCRVYGTWRRLTVDGGQTADPLSRTQCGNGLEGYLCREFP